ncbi:unnamed protein product [Bathycoccus prasinos]
MYPSPSSVDISAPQGNFNGGGEGGGGEGGGLGGGEGDGGGEGGGGGGEGLGGGDGGGGEGATQVAKTVVHVLGRSEFPQPYLALNALA